jgi:hypothetical protein
MKTLTTITLYFFLLSTNCVLGQFKFNHKISQSKIDSYGFNLHNGSEITKICGEKKCVVSVSSAGAINVDFWEINDNSCDGGVTSTTTRRRLELKEKENTFGSPVNVIKLPFQCWTIGLNTLPFRYRMPQTVNNIEIAGTTTSNFNLAVNFGKTWGKSLITNRGITNYSFTTGFFAGPSSADLKKETVKNPTSWTTNQTNATFTYGLNFVLARNNLGLVFALGFDKALGKNSTEWIYDNKPWFGFGVNTSFLR